MRKDLTTLLETGMRVKDVGTFSVVCGAMLPSCLIDCYTLESHLSSTNFKGFPIVSSDGSLTLVGYIDRSEIRYVLGKLPMLLATYDPIHLFL
jgi:chloride channel 3/4/5